MAVRPVLLVLGGLVVLVLLDAHFKAQQRQPAGGAAIARPGATGAPAGSLGVTTAEIVPTYDGGFGIPARDLGLVGLRPFHAGTARGGDQGGGYGPTSFSKGVSTNDGINTPGPSYGGYGGSFSFGVDFLGTQDGGGL